MGKFFDIDGSFIVGLTKVADVFILNLLLILCCIPIITIGPAVTAMYYVTLKMVKDEDCYIVKSFFKSFKQNFKQGTLIWLILLAVGLIMYADSRIMTGEYTEYMNLSNGAMTVMSVLLMATTLLYLFTISYVFPVLARFDNTIKRTIANAFFMSVKHFPSTIVIIIVNVVPIILMYIEPRALILVFVIFGLSAYINSFFFVKIFKNYMPEEHITEDEKFEVQ